MAAISAAAALEVARAVGTELRIDGGDLLLEADEAPPASGSRPS
jgi:hypothetical protein